MAQVITEGSVPSPEEWSTQIKCIGSGSDESKGCGAILKVTKDDVVLMKWYGTHFKHHYPATQCPRCLKYTYIKELPDTIWKPLLKKGKAIFDGVDDRI
ncbi:MAG: hypothetical protein IPJ67_01080 [Candidatus Moraniibacteriota bacterium]|nr:MAG: hypothetical protein IPJ67_01080 [Candidatus Moranbacteria bacterium]